MNDPKPNPEEAEPLREGRDFVWEGGLMVLTAAYLLRRGYCCQQGCRNCPYPGVAAAQPDTRPR